MIVQGFDKEVESSLTKARKIITVILAFFAFLVCVMVIYFVVILSDFKYLEFVCFCTSMYSRSRLVTFLNRLVLFLIELVLFIFYYLKLRKQKVRVKYKILFELYTVSILWLLLKFFSFSEYLAIGCSDFYNDENYLISLLYFTLIMHVLIFSFTILTPLIVASKDED